MHKCDMRVVLRVRVRMYVRTHMLQTDVGLRVCMKGIHAVAHWCPARTCRSEGVGVRSDVAAGVCKVIGEWMFTQFHAGADMAFFEECEKRGSK